MIVIFPRKHSPNVVLCVCVCVLHLSGFHVSTYLSDLKAYSRIAVEQLVHANTENRLMKGRVQSVRPAEEAVTKDWDEFAPVVRPDRLESHQTGVTSEVVFTSWCVSITRCSCEGFYLRRRGKRLTPPSASAVIRKSTISFIFFIFCPD